ncbi:PQQ-like beta-propeller repeat protein [Candidatus Micrarchaeota archaeon]|nr:PQQ-like beta-propeller repeat protein [Candidatus Micrarchaeota archaeon]
MLLHGKKIERSSAMESTARFRSASPYSEGIFGRAAHRMKSFTAKILTATMLFASTAGFYGCSDVSSTSVPSQTQVIKVEEGGHAFGKTNEQGKTIFYSNGKTYELNVIDGETGQPINGLLISFSVDNKGGLYLIVDPENSYFARFAGAGMPLEQKADSSDNNYVSNITTYRKNSPCAFATKSWAHVDFGSEQDMKNLYAWNQEWLAAEDNLKLKVKNPLTASFNHEKKVKLKDLNNSIKLIFELVLGEAIEADIEVSLITWVAWLGVKGVEKSITGTASKLTPLIILDLCALAESLDWTKYYNTLCYKSEDEFDIWKSNSFPDLSVDVEGYALGAFISNPFILIIPKDKETNWIPPVAEIKGKVTTEGYTASFDWGVEVQLENTNGYMPTITYPHTSGSDKYTFYFTVSACKNTKYRVSTKSSSMDAVKGLTYDQPSLFLTVEEGQAYTVDFHLVKGCGSWRYEVKKTGTNSYEVICNPNKSVCSSIEKYEPNQSSSLDIKALLGEGEVKFAEARGCLGEDLEGHIYFSGKLNQSDPVSLYRFDPNLNLVWSLPGAGNSTPILSSEGVSYTSGSDGKIHAVSLDGTLAWVSDSILAKPSALSLQNDIYAVNASSVYAITKDGTLKWEFSSPGSQFENVTVGLQTNKTVHVADLATNTILTLDSETGREVWKFWISEGIVSPPSIAGEFLHVGSVSTVYKISKDGGSEFAYADNTGLFFTSPTFDGNGRPWFVGWNPDCSTTLEYFTFKSSEYNPSRQDRITANSPTIGEFKHLDENGKVEPLVALAYSTTDFTKELSCAPLLSALDVAYFLSFSSSSLNAWSTYVEIEGYGSSTHLGDSSWPTENHDSQNTRNVNSPTFSPIK